MSVVASIQSLPAEADLSLLQRFVETGDADAFAEIVRRYAGVVYSASRRILGDDGRAQDVSQETFFRLMRQPRLVTHSLAGWLHRSATHLALDVKRSERCRVRREKTYSLQRDAARGGATEPSWDELSPYVDTALNEVAEPARTLLVRHFLQGTSQAELAVETGASPATVSRRIKAGVDELQQHLRNRGIYLGLAALVGFCASRTAEAAPAQFLVELGKMRMVGSMPLGPMPGPRPQARYPSTLQPPARTAVSTARTMVSYGGAAALAAVMAWAVASACPAGRASAPPAGPSMVVAPQQDGRPPVTER